MRRLERILALPLYLTVAWLLWVLSQQTGPAGLAACLAGLVLIAVAAWLHEATRHTRGTRRIIARTSTAVGIVGALALTIMTATPRASLALQGNEESYTAARLAELRARGVPVFVNVTAAWCITCLVN